MVPSAPYEAGHERAGALDLGSNMFRLVVGSGRGREMRVGGKFVEVVSIARDVDATGTINDAAIARGKACLERFRVALGESGVHRVRAVATAAFRNARNGEAVARSLGAVLGYPIEIVPPEREARLALAGVALGIEGLGEYRVLDIGGASTEYSEVRSDGVATQSIDIGVISLNERIGAGPSSRERGSGFERHCRAVLAPFASIVRAPAAPCFAVGGAAVALAAFESGSSYEAQLAGSAREFSRRELDEIHVRLMGLTLSERAHRLRIGEFHAELVEAGYYLLKVGMDFVGAGSITPTGRGVAEGLLWESLVHAD